MDKSRKHIERNIRRLLLRHGYLLHTNRTRTDFRIMAPVKQFGTIEELKSFVDTMRYKMDKTIE
jgi:hypothetical protein